MSSDRRLKRGLKDLSPIFNSVLPHEQKSYPIAPASVEEEIHSFVHFTELGGDTVRQEFYSSLLVECQKRSFLPKIVNVTNQQKLESEEIKSYFPSAISKQRLSWDEFRHGKKMSLQNTYKNEEMKTMTIFDVHSQISQNFKDFMPLIDHWVFVVEPKIEQLSEVYRMIKGTRILNHHLKYYLLFKTTIEDAGVTFLKNEINRLMAKHLQCEILDLGCWGNSASSVTVSWDAFFEAQDFFKDEYANQKDSFLYYIEHGQALEQRAI